MCQTGAATCTATSADTCQTGYVINVASKTGNLCVPC